ncbi:MULTISPECIES: glycoside hydrolase family 76 protein [Streptacidiphilus]|uniref:Glycoside hydrolase family 76 protein n=1 Tax=Streptacidiphilus cavernicola TaxID=3342716 RepID=A0ABV6UM87_9ACTN|nr:glycoside hydrolase family 76 protein [Streptacidiphilus jeojiense]
MSSPRAGVVAGFSRLLRFLLVAAVVAVALVPAAAPARAATTVCVLACDTQDPSLAKQESFPVPNLNLNGRQVELHVSDADDMAWASIDGGVTGDSVWIDRSWDGGASWDGLLGKASIPSTWTGTRTLMYNITDARNHRRGLVRACGDAAAVGCTNWAYPTVCDTLCDGTDPAQAAGDVQPVASTTLYGRTIRLHVDQKNAMAWASIDTGGAGDEIWLDRSWDGGATWPDGSSLGRTSTPSGATGTRTAMYATRDPRGLLYGGAVRACGREASHQQGSCTAWVRPAPTPARGAADALMSAYDPYNGWWPSSWWNSAATLTALIDFARTTGTHDYDWVVARTFDQNKGVFAAGVRSSDAIEGDFISRANDDAAWWAIAWLDAYDYTGNSRYLNEAVTIMNYLQQYWDNSTCGGGIWWDRERTYKNAVINGQYLWLATALHQRIPGDTVWLQRATTAAAWYRSSGMIDSAGLVNDGLTSSCANNGSTVWSYNQGLAIGGFTELWKVTGDSSLLATARTLADAAVSSTALTSGGVLTESCDTGSASCDDNQEQFKGIFMRNFADLARATGSSSYLNYVQQQSTTLWAQDRTPLNVLGERWAGTSPDPADWRTQASALGALTAAAG